MKEVRQTNLKALIAEYARTKKITSDAGFAELITVDFKEGKRMDASYLSQLKGGHRGIGESTARNIEESLGLPPDWMDKDHANPATDDEAELLALFRKCDDRGRRSILSVAARESLE